MFESEEIVMKLNNFLVKRTCEDVLTINVAATGEYLGEVPAMSLEEMNGEVQRAHQSLSAWKSLSYVERARYLHRAADILRQRAEDMAIILSQEIAKPFKAAVSEVMRTADLIDFTAEEGCRLEGELLSSGSFSAGHPQMALVNPEPIGVVLAIAPFNYPVNLAASKIAPALIGGNTVVFKTPSQGALSGVLLAQAFWDAGLPAGVLTVVTGKGSVIGDSLVTHPLINFVNFTGSTEVGQHIAAIAGMKPVLLELGGKDPALVLEDADLKKAAREIVAGAFSYSGQRCTAIKRVLVMDSVANELVGYIQQEMAHLSLGLPRDNADITPLINTKAADKVEALVRDALEAGAVAVTPFKREGNLIWPTLLDQVNSKMAIAWVEPFGPVLPIIRVQSVDEAVKIANESDYGLQAAVFTNDYPKAVAISQRLEVGTVHINHKTQRGTDNFPFIGVKNSGMGTQGIKYSIQAMMCPKSIVFDCEM